MLVWRLVSQARTVARFSTRVQGSGLVRSAACKPMQFWGKTRHMECRYCSATNEEDDHRCCRCGRRLRANTARPAPDTYPAAITTATAPSLIGLYEQVARDGGVAPAAEPVAEPVTAQRLAYQRELFQEMRRVVAMPGPATPPPATRPVRNRPSRVRRAPEGQQGFDFNSPALETQVEAVIYCDAPVAIPTHRLISTAVDLSIIVIALGVFLLTFHLAGGDIVLNKQTIPFFAGIGAVLALFYHLLYCMAGGDTAGMQWTRLRLVDFDGKDPDREQRIHRLVGGCLSFVAAGLGLIWALVDEESLTWHDHISKTFPSPE